MGVNETAFDSAPSDWTAVLDEHELDGALVACHTQRARRSCSSAGAISYTLLVIAAHIVVAPFTKANSRMASSYARAMAAPFVSMDRSCAARRLRPQPRYEVRAYRGEIEIRALQEA